MTTKEKTILVQKHLGVAADGIIGDKTLDALLDALDIRQPADLRTLPTQAEVRSGKSIFGKPGQESELVSVTPPYQLYFDGTPVRTIRVHRLIADRVQRALEEILAHYGKEAIHRLGLDVYGGSYNYRSTSTGKALSMHAWGIALDFAPEKNAYSTHAPKASLSIPECKAWWEIWEKYGAVSLGRECDYDWMHLQFARLK